MTAAAIVTPSPMVELTVDGGMRLNLHPFQIRAWNSEKRRVVLLGGTQSGKTSFGPHWLAKEIRRTRHLAEAQQVEAVYLVATPTFPLLETKALPEFRRLFEQQLQLGEYKSSPIRQFTFSADGERRFFGRTFDQPTKVYFGYADDPESLESMTALGAWLDEAGQRRFKLGSYEAIERRLALFQGRALITTTPYDLGWLKQRLHDPWKAAGENHPDIDLINFPSIANPAFPRAEYDRQKATMPRWKFDLFYRARFTRPAGLIYDSFDPDAADGPVVAPFEIPDDWPRVLGADFGGANTAMLLGAQEVGVDGELTGVLYWYREYRAGSRTASQHRGAVLTGEPIDPVSQEPRLPIAIGGSGSEQQWRNEFSAAGLPIYPPPVVGPGSVEVGIDRVYAAHNQGRIKVFNTLTGYLEQKATYSRKVDASGEPSEEIEDKASFHFMDAERYLITWLMPPAGMGGIL